MAETLSINDRFALLEEAEIFFSDLSDAGEQSYKLGLRKAAAIGTVLKGLELYKDKMLNGEEWTEKTLADGLAMVIRPETIDEMIEIFKPDEKEASFYKGGFGLAMGIMEGDEETIQDFKTLQGKYDEVINEELQNRTIADLLK